jgi:hypothetical protein
MSASAGIFCYRLLSFRMKQVNEKSQSYRERNV